MRMNKDDSRRGDVTLHATSGHVVVPSREDVLLGRGVKHQHHPGNVRYNGRNRGGIDSAGFGVLHPNHTIALISPTFVLMCTELVRENRDRYFETTDLGDKRSIVVGIVNAILENNGRFLKHGDNDWEVIPRDKALVKTAQAIQYSKRKKNDCTSAVLTMMESKAEQHLRHLSAMQDQMDSDKATEASSQKILEFYSQWMERSNELFWQCVGPDARRLFPEDMAAVVPLSRNTDASVATVSSK
jgi:hypothetical protein